MNKDFLKKLEKRYSINFSEDQYDVIFHKDGPSLVLAVPGAGKTTVLIARLATLIYYYNIDPNSILSITFSRFAALNMKKRYSDLLQNSRNKEPKFSTIHSFAYNLIKSYSNKNSLSFSLIESDKTKSKNGILKEIYREIEGFNLTDDKLDDIVSNIGYVKNMMINIDEFKSYNIPNFKEIFKKYELYKKINNLIDFDDMLTLALEILSKNPDICEFYQRQYKYIQVDEGQDTSLVQYEIIKKISFPLNNLLVVADDDQSIYEFRGASPEFLLDFKNHFQYSKILNMSLNYRSSKNIVNLADNFISTNKLRYKKNLIPNKKNISNIIVNTFDTPENQYSFILQNITDPSKTAILFRNNISSVPIVDVFDRNDIPFNIKENILSFFNNNILKDIISFFKLSLNNSDFSSFKNIYYKMKGYISKNCLKYIENIINESTSVFSILENNPEYNSFKSKNIRELGFDFIKLSRLNPLDAIYYIESNLNYLEYIDKRNEFLGYGKESNLSYLSYIKSIAFNCNSILDFLDRIESLKLLFTENNSSSKGVFVSTIHSAKGLEFETVFIIDLINGDFPSTSSIKPQSSDNKELEEERRLFYVGMTRAKENLFLLSYNNKNNTKVSNSLFLNEVKQILTPSNSYSLINKSVKHNSFGVGIVVDESENTLVIRFNKYSLKQFIKDISLEKGIITILKE